MVAFVESHFEDERRRAGRPFDLTLIGPWSDDKGQRLAVGAPPASASQLAANVGLSLNEAYRQYLDDPTRAWSASTREAYDTSRKLAISVIGAETLIAAVSRSHCRDLLDVVRTLPVNAAKRFPQLTAREASDRGRVGEAGRTISVANANSLVSNLSSFLNWCVAEEMIGRNPARGLRIPDPIAKRDKRLPFTRAQLRTIFDAPLYRGCIDGARGYNKPGDDRPSNARYWVPLLGLHTGARLGEICQLDVTDIREIDNICCMVISRHSLVGSTDKRLKTGTSDRVIPIHSTLIECGFLPFVERKRRAGHTKLFAEITTGLSGSRSVAFSKWFTQFLKSCGAQAPRTCYHSFRHVFRDELRVARIDHDVAMLLGGWTTGASRTPVSEHYGSGHSVEVLQEAVSRLKLEEVDLRHLAFHAR